MALGLGATGEVFLEVGLFGHNLAMAGKTAGVLEVALGVHNVVQALFALFGGQVVMTAGAAAYGKAFLAVHQMVAGHALHFFMGGVGKHDSFLRAFDFNGLVRHGRCGPDAHGKKQGQHTGENKSFFHSNPPR